MRTESVLPVSIPKFDDRRYLQANPIATEAIQSGTAKSAVDHFIRFGIDENRYQLLRREPLTLACSVERFLVSESGFCLLLGWLADEGCESARLRLLGNDFNIELSSQNIFRNARPDVEQAIKPGAYDYGFVAFGRSPSRSLLKQSLTFQVSATAGSFQCKITPEIVSDKRLMDTMLQIVATSEAHVSVCTSQPSAKYFNRIVYLLPKTTLPWPFSSVRCQSLSSTAAGSEHSRRPDHQS